MKVRPYFDGIGGEWIEFQTSDEKGLDHVEFLQKDSIYLYGSQDLPFDVFGKFLSKHWPLENNQIDRKTANALADEIERYEELFELAEWIRNNMKNRQFLNVLGI